MMGCCMTEACNRNTQPPHRATQGRMIDAAAQGIKDLLDTIKLTRKLFRSCLHC